MNDQIWKFLESLKNQKGISYNKAMQKAKKEFPDNQFLQSDEWKLNKDEVLKTS